MTEALDPRLASALADRYRIERELGQGGMATVYLARDLKHDREVAIKVLHPDLAAALGAERFLAEIKTTANLQHPHILPLHDSGEANGLLFYVMPYVEGESLRDRLNREKPLPIDAAVRITDEIASALDYAHRHGVIHRDIKPENILLHDGRALVADFGIALAVQSAGGARMTQTGLSLGTPQYMSPEQAMGEKQIDARSDVYALGAVLYEMLTGDPPFTGSTVQAIVAKVMSADAEPVTLLRKSTPASVAYAVHKALEKLPADRFATAAEFASALHEAHADGPRVLAASTATRGRRVVGRSVFVAACVVAMVSLVAALWGWFRPVPVGPEIRYALALPADAALPVGEAAPMPSPDGSYLVYVGPNGAAGQQLWIKRRQNEAPAPIGGTDGAGDFAISPDSKWIAFTGPTAGAIRKISVDGGTAVPIVTQGAAYSSGLTWLDQNTIVFSNLRSDGISEVPVNGGAVKVLWKNDSLPRALEPWALPGGRGFLFNVCSVSCVVSDVYVYDARTGSAHRVRTGVAGAVNYIPSGYLAYLLPDGELFAVPFDLNHLVVTGPPISIADSLSVGISTGDSPFRVSASGTLVMTRSGDIRSGEDEMDWVDQSGRVTPVDSNWTFRVANVAGNIGWALSPDDTRLAIGLSTSAGDGIWVKWLPNGALQRITYDTAPAYRPRWAPGGEYITYLSSVESRGFAMHRADGTGTDSTLVRGVFDEGMISADGKWYLLRGGAFGAQAGGRDIRSFRPGVDTVPQPLIATPFDEEAITPSPDGHWLAYQSDETGRTEVYIRPFPNVNASKQQISRDGGRAPLWSRDGTKLYYLRGDKTMMVVRMTMGATLRASEPAALFRVPDSMLGGGGTADYTAYYTPWAITHDGRFLMARTRANSAFAHASTVVVVENWLSNWKRGLHK